MKKLILLGMMILSIVGCSPKGGVTIAFEELGGEVGSRNGNENTSYRSSVSISGLGQNQIVGTLLTVPGNTIADTYSVPIITGCSKVAVTTYSDNLSDKNLTKAFGYLTKLVSLNESLIAIQGELLISSFLKEELDKNRVGSKEYSRTVQGIRKIYSLKKEDNVSGYLKNNILRLTIEESNFTKKINEEGTEFSNIVNQDGVIVTKWNRSFDSSGSTSLGEITTISGNKHKDRGGYLILSGLKTESIWLGDDFAGYIHNRKDKGLTGSDSIMSDHGYIVTFALSAKKRAYIEEMNYSKIFSASLQAKVEKLKSILSHDFYQAIKNMEINSQKRMSRLINSSNRGVFIAPKKELYEFRFRNDEAFSRSMQQVYLRSNGYLPVYAIRSNIANLKRGIKKSLKPCECEAKVQNNNKLKDHIESCENNNSCSCIGNSGVEVTLDKPL